MLRKPQDFAGTPESASHLLAKAFPQHRGRTDHVDLVFPYRASAWNLEKP